MSLNDLARTLRELIGERHRGLAVPPPLHAEFRAGDVRHSQASIDKAQRLLGYAPTHDVRVGLREALPWYEAQAGVAPRARATGEVDVAAR
jgi:UDP-N-acetylglucosamine 4-epimerase